MAERVGAGSEPGPSELDDLADVSNVLLLAPSLGGQASDACIHLLARAPPAGANVLAVSYTRSAPDWVAHWTDHVGAAPQRGGIVPVGQQDVDVDEAAWASNPVDNPGDLTGIGIELSELLSKMATAAGDEETIVMCFDSITSLLQYADLQRAFRFLHVVTGRIRTVDALGHYHIDPEAHDRQTLATLKGLFDAVVEVAEDGSVTVQR